jgi:hypothetical protein
MANFKVILAKRRAGGLHLLDLRGQEMPAVLALFGQDGPSLVNAFGGHHGSMGSAMAGLSTRLPPTLISPASRAWLTGQSIGGWRLGGVRGVLFAKRQLALQIRDLLSGIGDLLLGVGDLPFTFGYLTAEFFVLSQ